MMDITSPQNPRVKHIVKLREDKRQRQKDGLLLVEGYDEIQLAIASGHKPQTLLTALELASRQITFSSAEILTVSGVVFEKLSYRDNPDGWLAVFRRNRDRLVRSADAPAASKYQAPFSLNRQGAQS